MKSIFCILAFAISSVAFAQPAVKDPIVTDMVSKTMPQFMKTWETLVNMDSGSDNKEGLDAKQKYLSAIFKELGGEITLVPTKAPNEGFVSIKAVWKGKGKAKILLLNHYDTVWPKGEAAKRPFHIDEQGFARGPGVYDSQVNLAALQAVIDIVIKQLKMTDFDTITVLMNPDEEIFNPGSQDLIKELASQHDVAYSLDGGGAGATNLTVSSRGIGTIYLDVKGVEAHSGGAPEKGRNAGYELSHQLLQLRNLSNKEKNTDVNWTVGSFGTKINVIPGVASAQANVRVADMSEYDRIEKTVTETIKNQLIPDTQVSFRLDRQSPPYAKNDRTDALFEKISALAKTELDRDLKAFRSKSTMESCFTSQVTVAIDAFGMGGIHPHALTEGVEIVHIEPRLYLLIRTLQETMKGNMVPIGTK